MKLNVLGAAEEVTGSCHLVEINGRRVLLDCGLIQGSREDEARNEDPFPFAVDKIDAVILSHSHIDHSGRLPLLYRRGYRGPIYTQRACRDLCRIMLKDAAFLNEKDAEWDNRKRKRKGLPQIEPLYGIEDAQAVMRQFKVLDYGVRRKIVPGCHLELADAGHILGSSIVQLYLEEGGQQRKLVFSGDLGHHEDPILRDPAIIEDADLVMMESTYGDRLHRSMDDTMTELADILSTASKARGNILIPAFAVGRSQEVLYFLGQHYRDWGLGNWEVFLDSPMAIQATEVYLRHSELFNDDAYRAWKQNQEQPLLPNLHFSRTALQSMKINQIDSGALIIAGSGMCTGGRIRHHLKHNVWRRDSHVVMVGFQARGTTGRMLVDGAEFISLWGEKMKVAATIHTVGGLSAHADQRGLINWYQGFRGNPRLLLVHGEADAALQLQEALKKELNAQVSVASPGAEIDLLRG